MWVSPNFDKCIDAIVETMSGRVSPVEPTSDERHAVTAFMLQTSDRMPGYLKLGFRALILVLDCWSYPSKGKPFHALAPEDRDKMLRRWETSRLGFKRSLMAFNRTLVAFGLSSEIFERDR